MFANGTVRLADGVVLDYETQPILLLPFEATDDHAPPLSSSAFMVLEVTDVNEAPVVTWPGEGSAPALSVLEDKDEGDVVGRIVATDPDNGQEARFRIDSQIPDGKLSINVETGVITLAPPPAESTGSILDTETQPHLRANITVYDTEFQLSKEVTIAVDDVDEPPVFTTAVTGALTVQENRESTSAGTRVAVGTVRALNPESGTAAGITYSIVSQDATKDGHTSPFVLDSATGVLSISEVEQGGEKPDLDHEFQGGFMAINISASDGTSPAGATVLEYLVTVQNVNEAPTIDASGQNFFAAASRAGTIGSPLESFISDEDLESTTATEGFNFTITSGDADGIFSVQQGTGQLFVTETNAQKPGFAYSEAGGQGVNEFMLGIEVRDRGGLTGTGTVEVTLTKTNVAPEFS